MCGSCGKKKLIRVYEKDGIKSLRLTQKGQKLLLEAEPARFPFLLKEEWKRRSYQYKAEDRFRTHLLAETYLFVLKGGASVFPEEKPELSHLFSCSTLENTAFYFSLEMKTFGDSPLKIRAARMAGLLVSVEKRGFLIYQLAGELMRWSDKSERKMKGYCEAILGRESCDSIFLSPSLDLLLPYLGSNGGKNNQFFSLSSLFEHFYFIPSTGEGLEMLHLIVTPDYSAAMKNQYLKGMRRDEQTTLSADGWIKERPILLAWDLDMLRIRYFYDTLSDFQKKGIVLVFHWQQEIRLCCKV